MKNSAQNCHVSAFAGPFVIKADAQAALARPPAPKFQAKCTPAPRKFLLYELYFFSSAEAPVE